MADKVHITKHGIQALKWDGDAGQYVEQKVRGAINVLRCECHLDADLTLGDVFRAVAKDADLVRFLEDWSWCNVEAFHSEGSKPAREASDLKFIEIAKYFEWDEWEAQESIHVSGIGEPGEHCAIRYVIGFTPVNELVHLPIRLRPEMEIHKDHRKLGAAPCTFTLLDILDGIYWEIGFYGSPEDRDRKAAELRERVRDVEEGRARLIPWEPPKEIVN